MLDVTFDASLEPAGCARPRAVRAGSRVRVYVPSKTIEWQHALARSAQSVLPKETIIEPVKVDILAVMSRPKRLDGKRYDTGFLWAPVRPDIDNIAKNVLDALRFAWRDDAQVVATSMIKVYAPKNAGARVVVRLASVEALPMSLIETLGFAKKDLA